MSWTKFSFQPMKLANAFALALLGFTNCFTPVQAQIANPVSSTMKPVEQSKLIQRSPLPSSSRVNFLPPPPLDQGAPSGRRRGGASRSPDGKNNDLRLTALVPGDNSKSFLALTVTEHPTFWFYVPYALTSESMVEFVLQDAADNYIYKTTFIGSRTPQGVLSLPIPPSVTPLKIGKRYHWTLSIQGPSNFVFVQGFVQRVALNPTLVSQLKAATQQERFALYAANGIWQDALTTLASLRRTNPQDATLTAKWVDLLRDVGLDDIATQPVVQCCTEAITAKE